MILYLTSYYRIVFVVYSEHYLLTYTLRTQYTDGLKH